MKKIFTILCVLFAAMGSVLTAGAATIDSVPITTVSDISLYSSYTPANMQFKELKYSGKENVYTISLPKAAIVRLNVNHYNVTVSTLSGNQVSSPVITPLTFTLAMDSSRVNKVKEFTSVTADFYTDPIYLEAGTYYLFATSTALSDASMGASSTSYVNGTFRVGALVQYANSVEAVSISSMRNPNVLANGATFQTFISDIAIEDWWKFRVSEKAMYDFKFSRMSGTGNISVALLNTKGVAIEDTSVDGAYSESSFSKYLDAGEYYIRFRSESTSGGVGGDITCEFTRTVYKLSSRTNTSKKTNQDVIVTLKTNFQVAQSCLVSKKEEPYMTDKLAENQSTWRKAVTTGTDTIQVAENGNYWLIAKDSAENVVYCSLKITNIDKKAPNKPSVSTPKLKKKYVSGKGEKGATVYVEMTYTRDGNTVTKSGVDRV